ncbi:hypothetical protein HS125_19825 [bacterium]|nr:hypothetical protein [bacterium]
MVRFSATMMRGRIAVGRHLWFSASVVLLLSGVARAEPSLEELLGACEFLDVGDVPEGVVHAPESAVYVALPVDGGDDNHPGTSLDRPFATLDRALEYAEAHSETALSIYLRRGVHTYKSKLPEQVISRGNLTIASLPGEFATVRAPYWPGRPGSEREATAFVADGSLEKLAFESLVLLGWRTCFELRAGGGKMADVVVRNVLATDFAPTVEGASSSFLRGAAGGEAGSEGVLAKLALVNVSVMGASCGVELGSAAGGSVRGVRLSHFNYMGGGAALGAAGESGVRLWNCERVLLDHCRIVSAGGGGMVLDGSNVAIVNSYVERAGGAAVELMRDGELINSILYAHPAARLAPLVVHAGPLRCVHSAIVEGPTSYLAAFNYDGSGSGRCEMVNSVFARGGSFYAGTDGLVALSNRFAEITPGAPLVAGQALAADATALNQRANCSGNAVSTLQFASPETGDWRSRAESDWVDAGATAGVLLPSFDYYGRARAQGNGPDIGPAERVVATPTPTPTPTVAPTVTVTPTPTYRVIAAMEARALFDAGADVLFVDVREDFEYRGGHVPGALNLPWNTNVLQNNHATLPEKMKIIYDQRGSRGAAASQFLVNQGHGGVYNLAGGLEAWLALPAPVRPPADYSHDDVVDAADLVLLLRVRPDALLDLNEDFAFDYRDVFLFALSWGRVYRPIVE